MRPSWCAMLVFLSKIKRLTRLKKYWKSLLRIIPMVPISGTFSWEKSIMVSKRSRHSTLVSTKHLRHSKTPSRMLLHSNKPNVMRHKLMPALRKYAWLTSLINRRLSQSVLRHWQKVLKLIRPVWMCTCRWQIINCGRRILNWQLRNLISFMQLW